MTSTHFFMSAALHIFSRFIFYFAIYILYLGPMNVNSPQIYGQQPGRAIWTVFQMQYFYIAPVREMALYLNRWLRLGHFREFPPALQFVYPRHKHNETKPVILI